jgi:hypothetical protein
MTDNHDGILADLTALEHAGWRALCEGTAVGFYTQTMALDGLMVIATGQILDRDTVLDVFEHAPTWHHYEIADARLLTITDDVVTLVYRGSGWRTVDDPPFTATMTSTYRRHTNSWELVLYHQVAPT